MGISQSFTHLLRPAAIQAALIFMRKRALFGPLSMKDGLIHNAITVIVASTRTRKARRTTNDGSNDVHATLYPASRRSAHTGSAKAQRRMAGYFQPERWQRPDRQS